MQRGDFKARAVTLRNTGPQELGSISSFPASVNALHHYFEYLGHGGDLFLAERQCMLCQVHLQSLQNLFVLSSNSAVGTMWNEDRTWLMNTSQQNQPTCLCCFVGPASLVLLSVQVWSVIFWQFFPSQVFVFIPAAWKVCLLFHVLQRACALPAAPEYLHLQELPRIGAQLQGFLLRSGFSWHSCPALVVCCSQVLWFLFHETGGKKLEQSWHLLSLKVQQIRWQLPSSLLKGVGMLA